MSNILATTYDGAVAVTPSDSAAQFTSPAAGFIVGSAGTVTLITARNQTVQFTFGLAGQGLSIAFTWIKFTGTSCTGIIALTAPPFIGNT